MTKKTCRKNDEGISEMVSEVLIISLVVILVAIVAAAYLGYIPLLQKPQLSPFAVNAIQNSTTGNTSIEIHLVTGDALSASNQGGPNYAIGNMSVALIDPNGTRYQVQMCRSMPPTTAVNPGTQLYIFRRQQPVYYLATDPLAGNCGSGGGGGGGSGGGANVAITPHGAWRIIISDTGQAKMVIYDGYINL